jgi:hypothetical protein
MSQQRRRVQKMVQNNESLAPKERHDEIETEKVPPANQVLRLTAADVYGKSSPADLSGVWNSMKGDAPLGMNGPGGGLERIVVTTADGIAHTPEGLYNACVHSIQHPGETLGTLAASAAIAAAVKLWLPQTGTVGKLAGAAMGAWFIAGTAPGFISAYKSGLNAQTWSQMHEAGRQWGDAAGQLAVNSALGTLGYKIGAGFAGEVMPRESFKGLADSGQKPADSTTGNAGVVPAGEKLMDSSHGPSPSEIPVIEWSPEEFKEYMAAGKIKMDEFEAARSKEFLKREFAYLQATPEHPWNAEEFKEYQAAGKIKLDEFNAARSKEYLAQEFGYLRWVAKQLNKAVVPST